MRLVDKLFDADPVAFLCIAILALGALLGFAVVLVVRRCNRDRIRIAANDDVMQHAYGDMPRWDR